MTAPSDDRAELAEALDVRIGHQLALEWISDDANRYFTPAQTVEIGLADMLIDAVALPKRPCCEDDGLMTHTFVEVLARLKIPAETLQSLRPTLES